MECFALPWCLTGGRSAVTASDRASNHLQNDTKLITGETNSSQGFPVLSTSNPRSHCLRSTGDWRLRCFVMACSSEYFLNARGKPSKTCRSITNVMWCNGYYLLAEPFDRVMQLNWLYFCGICQLIPLKLWPNTVQGWHHQSICMPQLQPLCSAVLVPNVLPWRDEGSGKPCAVIEAS